MPISAFVCDLLFITFIVIVTNHVIPFKQAKLYLCTYSRIYPINFFLNAHRQCN